jgi:hypothetical protein
MHVSNCNCDYIDQASRSFLQYQLSVNRQCTVYVMCSLYQHLDFFRLHSEVSLDKVSNVLTLLHL